MRLGRATLVAVALAAGLVAAGATYAVRVGSSDGPALSPDLERGYRVTAEGEHRKVSQQWSGYLVTGHRLSQAKASFVVPAVHCSGDANASFWVGLDGAGSTTVEQAGVQALCRSGDPVYSAWSQFYPSPAQDFDVRVVPGDSVRVVVTSDPSGLVALRLSVNGREFSVVKAVPDARFASAEVIAEQSGATGDPLSPFEPVTFSEVRLDGLWLGKSGAHSLDMLDARGAVLALPSQVLHDGFSVSRP